jgi:N-methylhydantoinase B/oxoprolinase/acetone carboxylase alpha subunit
MKDQKTQTNQMIALQTPEMSTDSVITFPQDVQDKIDDLTDARYALDDMVAFIEEYGNDNFIQFYEEYVENGENYCYEAVDAFIDEFGIENIEHFTDAYYGQYDSEEQFAEQYTGDVYGEPPSHLVIDWQQTWATNLSYDYAFNDGYVFVSNF